jgi:signal transduction histidine kinase
VLLGIITLSFVLIGFNFFYNDIASILVSHLMESVERFSVAETAQVILAELQYAKMRALVLIALSIIIIKIVFGYVMANATLRPARNTLSAQKQFIGNVAHELRTPLSIIKTNMEVALLDEIQDPKLVAMFQSNIEELDRINNLINNLVSINSLIYLEPIEFRGIDLGAVVDGAVEKLTDYANRRGLSIVVTKSDQRVVRGNATALEQIVMNLLKNSIAYTPEGGTIEIAVEPEYQRYMSLSVKDNGVGIDKKDLLHLFEPFYRADRSRARESGGSGLGLTIVNEIVKLHRGKISIRSALRKGTTITVLLPRPEEEHKRLPTI